MTGSENSHRPRGTRLGILVALALGLYLILLLAIYNLNSLGYKYVHFLFDYENGLSRRALAGEIFRWFVAPPYSIQLFYRVAEVLIVLNFALFTGLCLAVVAARKTYDWAIFAALLATSPLAFKQTLLDAGRQDLFGFMALELTFLLTLCRSPVPAGVFLAVAIVPLSLINENLLLLYVTAALGLLAIKSWQCRETHGYRPLTAAFVAATIAVAINLSLPAPRIDAQAYGNYLATKSLTGIPPGTPHNWLYTGVRENFAYAAAEWGRQRTAHVAHLADYAAFAGVNLLIVAWACAGLRKTGAAPLRAYLGALAFAGCGYLVLFFGAADIARWLANLGTVILFVTWFTYDAFGVKPERRYIPGLVVAFQFLLFDGFGVTVPSLGLSQYAQVLSSFFH